MVGEAQVSLERCGESRSHGIQFPVCPPRSESLYRLGYSDPTQSEDTCSNVLFIRITSRIFPNPEYKDAVPNRFTVNDHEIQL